MAIFVDELRDCSHIKNYATKRYGSRWCHMWCDGDIEELHLFALKIGLKRQYFQKSKVFDHYDLIPSKRMLAIRCGAEQMSLKTWLREKIGGGIKGG